MIHTRLSGLFFLLCLLAFTVGSVLSFPPLKQGWQLEQPTLPAIIHGETSTAIEKELEEKLSYKDIAIAWWGSVRYALFDTGTSGVIIGEDEWLFTKEEFETHDGFAQTVQQNLAHIKQNINRLQAHGIAPVIVWVPAKSRIYADKLGRYQRPQLHQDLQIPTGLPLVDGNQVLASLNAAAFMRTDTHWSPAGAEAMAQAVANYITQHYPELEYAHKAYSTQAKIEDAAPYRGDLAEFVPTGEMQAYIGPASESVTPYQTESTEGSEAGLFGDEALDIVLIGTSYSAQKDWHFEGFLKQALQADVLNLADEGQGPFAPMDAFLERLDNGETSAKLVIWEFPERYLPRIYKAEENS